MNRRPPRLAAALLNLVVPREERESIPGDLAEEFATAGRSNLWYWRQVMKSFPYLAWKAFVRRGLAVFAGGAVMSIALVLTEISVRVLLPSVPHKQPLQSAFTLAVLALGVFAAAVAGYVTAQVAGLSEVGNLVILGALLVIISGYWLHAGAGSEAPIWYRGALILLVLPAALYGGRRQAGRIRHS